MDSAKPVLYFHHAGLTDTGLMRSHNEDALKLPSDVDADTLDQKGHFYVLADGMGGHQKGEVASAVTIETTHQEYYASVAALDGVKSTEVIVKAMAAAIEKANDRVLHATEGGGTTVVAATLYDSVMVVMNIGDSRAYLLRGDELNLISRDHSLVFRLREMGKITEEEALNHPRQNVLYQALGQGDDLEIHVFTDKLQLGDTIILCSDGLWGPVGSEVIKEVLQSPISPREAARQLVEMANTAGGPDNITTIIIRVCAEGSPADSCLPEVETIPSSSASDDTHPSLEIVRPKPHTLPEGKFYVVKD